MKCFVIQPFSQPYQKRYRDVFAPAIEAAGMKPYKVDEDPSAVIPIETIENEIRAADVCFADISEDNANVWFELGFALAEGKAVCIVCASQSRPKLPFDVQHRKVLFYDSESPSDFIQLAEKITTSLQALVQKVTVAKTIAERPDQGLKGAAALHDHELACLVLIAADQLVPTGSVSVYGLKTSMSIGGFTDVATALGLRELQKKELVEVVEQYDDQETYQALRLTDAGWDTLSSMTPSLPLKKGTEKPKSKALKIPSQDLDDEIPF